MKFEGGCHCGNVRYEATGEPQQVALCHCSDCRSNSGAPMVAWAIFPSESVRVLRGETVSYSSNGESIRRFCGTCGTGLLFVNEKMIPGMVDIQLATFDDPQSLQPFVHFQIAERIDWMVSAHELPAYSRYPGL